MIYNKKKTLNQKKNCTFTKNELVIFFTKKITNDKKTNYL